MVEELSDVQNQSPETETTSNAIKLVEWIEDNPADSLTVDESREALISLLWLIHAPHSLMQFLSVVPQLSTILECLDELIDDENRGLFTDLDIKISDLILVAQHLNEHQEDLFVHFKEVIKAKPNLPNAIHPMHNHLGRYYVYAAIMTTIEVVRQLNA